MIRALTLALLTALPATAQDFRGLRPGMSATALGPIGEPEAIAEENGVTLARYPLPFEQKLEIVYDSAGELLWLTAFARVDAPARAPDLGGLRVHAMTLRDVRRALGLSWGDLDTPGLAQPMPFGGGFRLFFDRPDVGSGSDAGSDMAPDAPDTYLIVLTFLDDAPSLDLLTSEVSSRAHRDTPFVSAELMSRSWFDNGAGADPFIGGPRPGPIPFPIPIDDAFPSLIP